VQRISRIRTYDFTLLFSHELNCFPRRLRAFFTIILSRPNSPMTVDDVACATGVTRQQIGRLLSERGLESAHWYIGNVRLLAAARLLDVADLSVAAVAAQLPDITASNLHALCRRYAGISLRELREHGALSYIEVHSCLGMPFLAARNTKSNQRFQPHIVMFQIEIAGVQWRS
jgi:transcriptional regulator GlxA family with amidase domain